MTSPTPDQPQPPAIRISDSDRETAAELLRAAVADGRLELSELDDRLEATYAAKTASELATVTADLPAPLVDDDRTLTLQTASGSRVKEGRWSVPSQIVAKCTSGRIKLDFTAAECRHQHIQLRAEVTSGSVVLIVPPGWGVNADDVAIASGSVRNRVAEQPTAGAPLITVHGAARSGSIVARYPRRTFWQWLRRQPVV